MNENDGRTTDTVPASIHDWKAEKTLYVSKKKGAPGFSGRSTRTIHAACARARQGGQGTRQAKQIK